MLSVYDSADHNNWAAVLPFMSYAYNTAVQATTIYLPFYLLYKRGSCSAGCPHTAAKQQCTVGFLLSDCEGGHQLAVCRTLSSQDSQYLHYSVRHKPTPHAKGDLVLLWTPICCVGREELLSSYTGLY